MFGRLFDALKKRNSKDYIDSQETSRVISREFPTEKLAFYDALSFVIDKNGVNALNDKHTLYILSDICDFGKYPALKSILSESIRCNLFVNIESFTDSNSVIQALNRIKQKLIHNMGFDCGIVDYFMNTISNILAGVDCSISQGVDVSKGSVKKDNPSSLPQSSSKNRTTTNHIKFLGCQLGCSTDKMIKMLMQKGFHHTGFSYDKTRPEMTGDFIGIPNCKIYIWSTPKSKKVWKIEILVKTTISLIRYIYKQKYQLDNLAFSESNFSCKIVGGEIQVTDNHSKTVTISYEDSETFQLRQDERNADKIRKQKAEDAARRKIIDNLNIDDI